MIDPHVEPVRFAIGGDGELVAAVQQTVRDLEGKVLSERLVNHIFRIEDGLIRRFDIGTAESDTGMMPSIVARRDQG